MASATKDTLPDYVDYYRDGMQIIEQWTLLSNPWVALSIVVAYLVFVIRIGPNFMKNREPYALQPLILMYNAYQVILNGYLVSRILMVDGAIEYVINNSCYPKDPAKNPLAIPFFTYGWVYFLSRIVDFVDTVFFTLTKKPRLVTFLHVFHHTVTVLITFYILKYTSGEQIVVWGLCNCVVHFVMYCYYFVAALGPSYRHYLWWKPYMTGLQLLQFVIVGSQAVALLIYDCPVPKDVSWIILIQAVIYIVLFSHFFWKAYMLKENEAVDITSDGISADSAKLKIK